ncbi:MAG: VCBS repeat-containing protein [Burkholderiaceae bacterium]|nr:VCBS repeat-containing protein [Rhodoferax sp.]MCP5286500.1 VCBS repeat-containing protein [Burkholderiaceae bacterium]
MRVEDERGEPASWRWRDALVVVFAVVGLSGCGGGGGSASPTPPPPTSTERFDASYVGYAPGDRRFYRLADGSGFEAERVQQALTVRGVPAVELVDMAGTPTYLAVDDQGVHLLPAESDQGVQSLFGAVPLVRFGPATASSEVLYDVSKQITFHTPQGSSVETRSIRVVGWVKGFEDITTSLGTFQKAARVRTEITSTAVADNITVASVLLTEEWYVQGVGVVRRDVQSTATGSPIVSASYELLAYEVGARKSDERAPVLASAVVAAPVQQPLPPPYIGVTYVQTTTFGFDDWIVPTPLLNGPAVVRDAENGISYQGTLSVGDDLRSLRFTLEIGLPSNRPLILTLPDTITDWAGNRMAEREIAFTRDTLGPQVVSMSPTPLGGDIGASAVFRVNFDEAVRATGATAVVIRGADGTEAARLPVLAEGASLLATLTEALPGVGVAYDWTLEGPVLDAAGNAAAGNFPSAQFVTTLGRFASAGPVEDRWLVGASSLVDLDGDGRPDFVYWASQAETVGRGRLGVRLGQADGGFGADTMLIETPDESTGLVLGDLRVGDFDGDGRRDVALAIPGRLRVYRQRTPMTFEAGPTVYGFLGNIAGVIPGAGGPDTLLVIRYPDTTETRLFERLRLNAGSGTWSGFAQIARDDSYRGSWGLVDLDGDGRTSLAWLRHTDDGVTELSTAMITADGFGTIVRRPLPGPASTTIVPYGARPLVLADVDADGVADLVSLQTSGYGEPPSVSVLRGLGGGQFGTPRTVPVRRAGGDLVNDRGQEAAVAKERAVHVGDLDGDGLEDMLFEVQWSAGKLALLQQRNDGRFVPVSAAAPTMDNPVRDLEGNGTVDVVSRNRIYLQAPGP